MSKKYAEEKRKKNLDYLKTILFSIRFSNARAKKYHFLQKILIEIWFQTH